MLRKLEDLTMRLPFWRSAPKSREEAQDLAAAAKSALDCVRRQGGVMAQLLEREGRPELWIANSILRTVAVLGRSPGQSRRQSLTRKDVSGLSLSDNMAALYAPGIAEPRYTELGMRRDELRKYVRWAMTVQ